MTSPTVPRALVAFLAVLLAAGSAFAAKGKVTKKAGLSGSFGWEVKSDGKEDPAYVQSNLPSKEGAARISWLSKGKKLSFAAGTPSGTRVVIARAVTGTKITKLKKVRWEVSLDKKDGSDTPALTLRVYEQGGATTDFDLGSANSEAWIEVTWTAARTASSNDGEVTALRDGEVAAIATDLDNKAKLGAFAIGMLSNADQIQKKRSIFIDRVWISHL